MINKCVVQTVGVAVDKSFTNNQSGDTVQCYEIPCTGTVDGANTTFAVKVFGKGGDAKVVQGLEFNGQYGEFQGNVTYTLKKADNPTLFKQSQGSGFSGSGGGKKFTPQHELNAIRIAESVVMKFHECNPSDETVDSLADAIVKLARDKFIPYLRATSERHDVVAERDETKKIQAQTIRQLIATNDLTSRVQAGNATTGQLASLYEASGCDANKFVTQVRELFNAPQATAQAQQEIPEDDIPF